MTNVGTDTSKWAKEFCRLHGGDEGLMVGWFANAIEAGHRRGLEADAKRIEELEAEVEYWRKQFHDEAGLHYEPPLKAAEVETPERPSKPDPIPPQSSSAPTGEMILHDCDLGVSVCSQADFQEHKRDTEQTLKDLLLHTRNLDQTLDSVVDRLRTLEARMLEASPSREGSEGNASTPASHGSEDKTPIHKILVWQGIDVEPGYLDYSFGPFQRKDVQRQEGDHIVHEVWAMLHTDRRSGKERRVWLSGELTSQEYVSDGENLYPRRRKSARRKSDRRE